MASLTTIIVSISTKSGNGLNKMNFEDSLKDKIKQLDIKKPQHALLVKQIIEYWASLKDTGINNQLLQDLVLKYSAAGKKLKQLNQELLDKQNGWMPTLQRRPRFRKAFCPKKLIQQRTWRLRGNLSPVNIWAETFSICFNWIRITGPFTCSMSAGMGCKRQ